MWSIKWDYQFENTIVVKERLVMAMGVWDRDCAIALEPEPETTAPVPIVKSILFVVIISYFFTKRAEQKINWE